MKCAACGAPIKWSKPAGGYLHTEPLNRFRISRREVQDILADRPRKGQPLHRQSVIHPAHPGKGG